MTLRPSDAKERTLDEIARTRRYRLFSTNDAVLALLLAMGRRLLVAAPGAEAR